MDIFKNYTFTWWQAGILQISAVCIGVALGAHWPEIFAPYTTALIVIAVMLGTHLIVISFKK